MGRGYRDNKFATGDDDYLDNRVGKNPFYRTMEIFNGVFKKNIKLLAGAHNSTNLHTIYVNFGELTPSTIVSYDGPGRDRDHMFYVLECGHRWEGRTLNTVGNAKIIGHDRGMCAICGADQIYRGFEHEWQHIIFKSDLALRRLFCAEYANQLSKQAPHVDVDEIQNFLSLLVNAFDDIRVNSLWEKIYPGSANAIWARWRNFVDAMGDSVNTSFLSYIFAVAFQMPTDPQGEFEPLRPVVEWAAQKVKYRGFANMLVDIRIVVDRCMGALLARVPPKPADDPQQGATQSDNRSTSGAADSPGVGESNLRSDQKGNAQDAQSQDPQEQSPCNQAGHQAQQASSASSQANGSSSQGSQDQNSQQASQGGSTKSDSQANDGNQLVGIPASKDVQATDRERSDAMHLLIDNAQELDPKEEHSEPTEEDFAQAKLSQATRAALAKVLNQDITDIAAIDAKQPDEPDQDMKQQLDQLRSGITDKNENSQLTDGVKAKVIIIDVTTKGVGNAVPELDTEARWMVQRMRSAFYRTMGKQKAKRSSSGNTVDVQALIQYRADHQDPNIFENEDINQGFAYSILCDMSGSMNSTYPMVCSAVEMLKQALKFPFVTGNMWGFRGGEAMMASKYSTTGEVWMYKYAKDVHWYTGTTPHKVHNYNNGIVQVPVKCGGITPMNSAINVASAHMWRKLPAGMSKRLFLLTDGAPMQVRVSGGQISETALRGYVAKEIHEARKHGIQVYTIVIGRHAIDEDKCLQMFGPRKFWRRVGEDTVGTVLSSLVLDNFSRYIRARG